MSYISLKSYVQGSKMLSAILKPVSKVYASAAGYRQIGLRYDDLIAEENDLVQEALRRLEIANPKAINDRAYRIRMAQHCSLTHQLLPESQWVKPDEDVRYLLPYIEEVQAEMTERETFDNIKVTPRH